MRIQGDNIYLKMLERKDCKTLWNDYEYDLIIRRKSLI